MARSGGEETRKAAKELAEYADRQKEARPRGGPSSAVERDATAGHDHVDMRMVRHSRPPGTKHGGDADACAEMLTWGTSGSMRVGSTFH